MRLLLTALNCPKGELAHNLARSLTLVEHGRSTGCDLVLLPEMSLTGSRASAAIPLDHQTVRDLVAGTRGGPAVCFGLVESPPDTEPFSRPYITQIHAAGGAVSAVHRKAGVAPDELSNFRPGTASAPLSLAQTATSLAVCAEIGTAPPYSPGNTLVLGPAAPGLYGPRRVTREDWQRGFDWWRGSVLADAERLLRPGTWLAVSTQAGPTDDEDFPGWAALVASGGRVVAELPDHRQGQLVVDLASPTPGR